jgi:ankyrin repeat protein
MRSPDSVLIHTAVMGHSLPEVIQALSLGEKVDVLDREGRSPLFYAAKDGDLAIVGELIRRGARVNAQDTNLETPLHFAVREFRVDVAKYLIENGANVNARDIHGNTPLSHAVFESRGRGDMIALLLSAGADKSLKNDHGVSPQELAKSIGNYDVSTFLR